MTQRNRAKLEVETLEDRITPAHLSYLSSKLCELKSTLQAKIGTLPSSVSSQLSALKAKINSLNSHNGSYSYSNGYSNGLNGSSYAHTKISSALQTAYNKLVAIGAPQSVIDKVVALQAKFGGTTTTTFGCTWWDPRC